MGTNASWLIAAGAFCLNLGDGLCWNGCSIVIGKSSSSWVMFGIAALYPFGGTWWYVINDEVAGSCWDFSVVNCSCVVCVCRICLSRVVCCSISVCRRFLEICFAELRLLLIDVPLLNRGDRRGWLEVKDDFCFGWLLVTEVLVTGGSTSSMMVGIGVLARVLRWCTSLVLKMVFWLVGLTEVDGTFTLGSVTGTSDGASLGSTLMVGVYCWEWCLLGLGVPWCVAISLYG